MRLGSVAEFARSAARRVPPKPMALGLAIGVALLLGTSCAGVVVPSGTLDELHVLRGEAVRAERVADAVAISQAIVDRKLALLAAADPTITAQEAANAWFELGDAQVAAYDRESARQSYERVLDLVGAMDSPPGDPIDSRAHTALALLDRTHPDALMHASRAVGILEQRYDGEHLDIVEARLGAADALWAVASIVDAHAELVRALADARSLGGETHLATAKAYYRLATASDALKRDAETESLYLASLAVLQRLEEAGTPADRELRAEIHSALAGVYKRARRVADSNAQGELAAHYSAWTNKQLRTKSLNPMYPEYAREKKVTGWVEVVFTISESGRTEDVHVVEATQDGTFERAALWAVQHWRYAPGLRDGVVTQQRGVRARLNFQIDE